MKKKSKFGCWIIILLLAVIFTAEITCSYSSYPLVMENYNRTAYSPLKGNITNPQIVWEYVYPYGTSNYFMSSIPIEDMNNDSTLEACWGAKDGYVRCVDASNGTEIWNYSLGGLATPQTSLIDDLDNDGHREVTHCNRAGSCVVLNGTSGKSRFNITIPSSSGAYIGQPSALNLTGDANKELIFTSDRGIFVKYMNGTNFWNYTASAYFSEEVSIADIDLDGVSEIITVISNNLTVFNSANGSIEMNVTLNPESDPTDGNIESVTLCDLNNDSLLDMTFSNYRGYVYGINNTGEILWNIHLGHNQLGYGSACADIDNDGKPEIVESSYDFAISAINGEDGSILWQHFVFFASTGGVSIADIDNDGELEVLAVHSNMFEILNGKYGYGERAIKVDTSAHNSIPSLADIDNDGFIEIIFGGRNYVGLYPQEQRNKILALDGGGTALPSSHKNSSLLYNNSPNWKMQSKNSLFNNEILEKLGSNLTPSITTIGSIYSQINFSILADDFENDGEMEIIAANSTAVVAISSNGTTRWKYILDSSISANMFISDANDDNFTDILVMTNSTIFMINSSSGQSFWNYTHNRTADTNSQHISAFDFDGDNQTEIFYAFKTVYQKFLVLEQNKSVAFADTMSYSINSSMSELPVADFNKDGILDILFTNGIGNIILRSMDDKRIIASAIIPGSPQHAAAADMNNDGFLDAIIGVQGIMIYRDPYLPYGGNSSGIFAFYYNNSPTALNYAWNFTSENVTSGIAAGELDGGGFKEILFGDSSNTIYCLNATGNLLWNVTLDGNINYPPMITEAGSNKVAVVTTNTSIYIFNSTGGVYYNYNHSVKFSYSPIIIDIDGDCTSEMIIGDYNGSIMVFDFDDAMNDGCNPQINNLSGAYYACEGSSLSSKFNVTSFFASEVTITISPSDSQNPFVTSPTSASGNGTHSIEILSIGALTKSVVGMHVENISLVKSGICKDSKITNISVLEINNAPSLSDISAQTATVGTAFSYQAAATDSEDGNQASGNLTFNSTFLGTNTTLFSIGNTTGLVSFTPSAGQEGSYNVQICVFDKGLNVSDLSVSYCNMTNASLSMCKNMSLTINAAAANEVTSSSGGGGGGGATIGTPRCYVGAEQTRAGSSVLLAENQSCIFVVQNVEDIFRLKKINKNSNVITLSFLAGGIGAGGEISLGAGENATLDLDGSNPRRLFVRFDGINNQSKVMLFVMAAEKLSPKEAESIGEKAKEIYEGLDEGEKRMLKIFLVVLVVLAAAGIVSITLSVARARELKKLERKVAGKIKKFEVQRNKSP